MKLDSIDLTLWLAGISMEALLLALLIWRRIYRTLPVFFSYLIWCLCSEAAMSLALWVPRAYLLATLGCITVDGIFQLAILAELGRVVMRHNHSSPPSRIVIALLAALAAMLACFIDKWTAPTRLPLLESVYVVLLQIFVILRVVFLLTLIWCSSILGLRWPARELQIITGLGFYILVALCVIMLHTHNMAGMQNHWLDQILVASYLCALSCWIYASTTKGVEGR